MITRPTRDEGDFFEIMFVELLKGRGGELCIFEIDPPAEHIPEDFRLFEDFFEHEMFVLSFLGLEARNIDFLRGLGDELSLGFDGVVAIFDVHEISIIEENHIIHDPRERLCIGWKIKFGFVWSIPENEWTPVFDPDNLVWMIPGDEEEGIRSLEGWEDFFNSGEEISWPLILDEFRHHLRVGLSVEMVSFRQQRIFEFSVIFDNPIVHEIDVLIRRIMRMTILLRHAPMCRPTSVGYPIWKHLVPLEYDRRFFTQIRDLADGLNKLQIPIFSDHKPRWIISAVFQPFKPM